MAASISRRAFIQWLPDEPTEPTTTVVLTSPEGRFVDIRLLQVPTDNEASNSASSQVHGHQVDWAFAGVSTSSWRQVEKTQQISHDDLEQYRSFGNAPSILSTREPMPDQIQHMMWMHTIDSRFTAAEQVQDEGDMLPAPSLGLTLERGNMCNPATGQATDYVEGWIDEIVHDSAYVVLELSGETKGFETTGETKGLFIKLGTWMQGVARTGDCFALQRWHQEHDDWSLQAELGHMSFPFDVSCLKKLRSGDTVNAGNDDEHWVWRVIESSNG